MQVDGVDILSNVLQYHAVRAKEGCKTPLESHVQVEPIGKVIVEPSKIILKYVLTSLNQIFYNQTNTSYRLAKIANLKKKIKNLKHVSFRELSSSVWGQINQNYRQFIKNPQPNHPYITEIGKAITKHWLILFPDNIIGSKIIHAFVCATLSKLATGYSSHNIEIYKLNRFVSAYLGPCTQNRIMASCVIPGRTVHDSWRNISKVIMNDKGFPIHEKIFPTINLPPLNPIVEPAIVLRRIKHKRP